MRNRFALAAAMLGGLAMVASSSPAFATGARIDSMGGGSKAWTVEDEVNIFDFPSLLVRYGDMTYVDNLNSAFANTRFGFHLALGEDFVIGVFGGRINETTRPVGTGFDVAGNAFTGTSGIQVGGQASQAANAGGGPAGVQQNSFCQPGPNNPFCVGGNEMVPNSISNVDLKMGLMAAMNVADGVRLGFMLNILGDDGDNEQPNTAQWDAGALLIDLGLGLGLDLVDSELEIALGVEYGMLDDYRDGVFAANGQPGDLIQHWSASHFAIRLNGRFTYDIDDVYHLIAYARINYASQEVTQNNFLVTQGGPPQPGGAWSGPDLALGADLRMQLFEDVFVVPGIGLRYAQQTLQGGGNVDRDVDRLVSLPYYSVGVDVKVFDWMDFRFGASQSVDFLRKSNTPPATPTTEQRASSVATNVATGLGFKVPVQDSVLKIDVNVNPLFWLNGPDFITGAGNNTAPFGLTGAIQYDW